MTMGNKHINGAERDVENYLSVIIQWQSVYRANRETASEQCHYCANSMRTPTESLRSIMRFDKGANSLLRNLPIPKIIDTTPPFCT